MYTTNLGGHSGCQVLLCENEDDTAFVRKISNSLDYNERLKAQAEKQMKFGSNIIRSPRVCSTGYTNEGLYYFDMEYIRGITLAEKIKTIEIGRIRPLLSQIMERWTKADESLVEKKVSTEKIFRTKIKKLSIELSGLESAVVRTALKMLEEHDWSKIVESGCHGDMTLENIIVKDNQLYFIDFLDSFYDSWILDASTLLQDTLIMWSYRKESKINNNTLVRLLTFKDILIDALDELDKSMSLEVYYALLLKLIRIYPYTSDKLTYRFLDNKTNNLILFIRGKENI